MKFLPKKLHLSFGKKKLRASTATARRIAPPQEMEDDEPTMKLSSAFIVVLLLHLIAVGGIYAFNSIKAHRASAVALQPAAVELPAAPPEIPKATVAAPETVAPATAEKSAEAAPAPVVKPAPAVPVKMAVTSTKSAASKTAGAAKSGDVARKGPRDSGAIHTVTKGETPERIARRNGVTLSDLMKLNHLDDPNKLRIGQKLHIPLKRPATTTTASNS